MGRGCAAPSREQFTAATSPPTADSRDFCSPEVYGQIREDARMSILPDGKVYEEEVGEVEDTREYDNRKI